MKSPDKKFVFLISAVIVSGMLFSVYLKSEISSISGLKASIEELDKNYKSVLRTAPGKTRNLRRFFPEDDDITGFIEKTYLISERYTINNIAFEYRERRYIDLDTGKTLRALSSSRPDQRVINLDTVRVNFTCDYRNMSEFIRELQNEERLVTVESLKAKRGGEFLAVEVVVSIYSTGAL